VASGRARALAITGSRRLKALPDVPSLSESGIKGLDGIDPYTYYGLAGPAGLPASVVKQLNDAINRISMQPEVIAQMRDRQYAEPVADTSDAFRRYIEDDLRKWREFGKVVKLTE
jgi:tripartite-type tricarboxylate transporter receptor subunit TctC